MDRLRSLDKIHLNEKQYLCFSKVAKNSKYAGKSFVEDASVAYPSWQQLMENIDSHPYFIWPSINGWLGALNQGLKETKCPEAYQLYSDILKAYEHCHGVRKAEQICRSQRRHDSMRVMCFVYFISLGEGLFQVSLNPPASKKSSDMNLSRVWHRWSVSAKELNMMPNKRDEIFQSKVRKLAMEAGQVNRVGQAWPTQLPTTDHLIPSIPCDSEDFSLNKELPLGFEEEIRRAVSTYLVKAQKESNIKFNNEIRLKIGKKLQTFARKRIHKRRNLRKRIRKQMNK